MRRTLIYPTAGRGSPGPSGCLFVGWVLLMSLIRPPMKFSADHQASAPPPIDYHHHISRVLLPVLILLPLYITQARKMISFPSR